MRNVETAAANEEIIVDDAHAVAFPKSRCLNRKYVRNLKMDGMGLIDWRKVELLKPSADGEGSSPGARKKCNRIND